MPKIESKFQKILTGSSKINKDKKVFDKDKFMQDNMEDNLAYILNKNSNKNLNIYKSKLKITEIIGINFQIKCLTKKYRNLEMK